jgi:outer membrane protein W
MKSSVVVVLCVAFLLGLLSACFADDMTTGLNGRNELMAAATWTKIGSGDNDVKATLVGINYGKFIDPNIEVQLGTIYANADFQGDSVNAWVLTPGVAYHFVPKTPSAIVPYAGVGIAYARIKGLGESDSSTKFQYFGGAKFFIGGNYNTANKAVFVEYRHTDVSLFGDNAKLDMVWAGLDCLF